MFYLVCFDIVDDRTRTRAVKILKDYGVRVQKSVFECADLTEEKFVKMRYRLADCIDNTWDTVRFYAVCRECLKKMEYEGTGEPPAAETYRII